MEHAHLPRWFKPNNAIFPAIGSTEPETFIYDLPFEKYLGDRSAISSSGIRKILKSPRHYLADLVGMLGDDDEEKDEFRFGRAAHLLILEPQKFKELHVVEPKFTGLTKDGRESSQSKEAKQAKEAWRKSLHPEAVLITQEESDHLTNMVDSLMGHSQISNLLKNGKPEVSGFFNDPVTGIRVRFRPDYLTPDGGSLFLSDIKTTRDASAGLFSNDAARFKYHVQLALYADGIKKITGKDPEAVAIIACEKTPPYSSALYWLNEEDIETGRRWYRFALDTLKRCMTTNDWPGIQRDGQMLSLPKWTENEPFPQFDWKS